MLTNVILILNPKHSPVPDTEEKLTLSQLKSRHYYISTQLLVVLLDLGFFRLFLQGLTDI